MSELRLLVRSHLELIKELPSSVLHIIVDIPYIGPFFWLITLVASSGFALFAHDRIAALGPQRPFALDVALWLIYAYLCCILMYYLRSNLTRRIDGLIGDTENHDDETWAIASYVATAIVIGIVIIALLLVFDYHGHSAAAAVEGRSPDADTASGATSKQRLSQLAVAGKFLGTYGDFFGGVLNPILTFGTLIALAITIAQQRTQVRHAKDTAQESANQTHTQTFETTFFNLLNLHAENVKNLEFDPNVVSNQRESFTTSQAQEDANRQLLPVRLEVISGRGAFGEILRSTARPDGKSQLEAYRSIQTEHNEILGHYFRHLYQILKLIDGFWINAPFEQIRDIRKRYANILRAQLSSQELATLLLNCTNGTVDEGKFRELLIKYQFFEHLSVNEDPKDGLRIAGIASGCVSIISEYWITDYRTQEWRPGAFGDNKCVREYLDRQTSPSWIGPRVAKP